MNLLFDEYPNSYIIRRLFSKKILYNLLIFDLTADQTIAVEW